MTRRKLVVGNWKMNGMREHLSEIEDIAKVAEDYPAVEVGVCVPATLIIPASDHSGPVFIGGQDVHYKESGAHTGCISAPMLKEAGATWVIVGHSERRADHHESNDVVSAKAATARAEGLKVILCVGESQDVRDAGNAEAVVADQLLASLPQCAASGWLTVAYEPIWAIGTGRIPTTEEVGAMHHALREALRTRIGDDADATRILYGGSMNGDNAAELMAIGDVDGGLVGGASLTAEKFAPIIAAAAG